MNTRNEIAPVLAGRGDRKRLQLVVQRKHTTAAPGPAEDADAALERSIRALGEAIVARKAVGDTEGARRLFGDLAQACAKRSPQQVDKLERMRGLG